ncbi:hypothetical protein KAR91_18285, partial [Candidatus Pacearchaeota archaeon]|nr:hypothetical protein [Candidatus Pacearchaeota archaeon]
HKREGIVIRPILELMDNRGDRFVAKHKCDEFRETKKIRTVSPEKLQVLKEAKAIAKEWVTEQRLLHVLDKVFASDEHTIERIRNVIMAMTEDVFREAKGEIVESREAKKAIGKMTASLFKEYLNKSLT